MAGPWEKFQGATPAPSTPTDNVARGPWEKFRKSVTEDGIDDEAHLRARAYLDAHPEANPTAVTALANKVGQGVTMGWADEAAAGVRAGIDTVRNGRSWSDNYALEKAMQDELLRRAGQRTGAAGAIAEGLGGIAGGLTLGGAIPLASRAGTLARAGIGALEGAGYGAVSGAGSAEGGDRLAGAAKGALVGGALGGAVPIAGKVAEYTPAKTLLNALLASRNPNKFAERKLVEEIGRSGQSIDDLASKLSSAGQEGQAGFTLADAMGEGGGSLLASLIKQPGEAGIAARKFLRDRQAESGRRLGSFASEAFEAPQTADQYFRSADEARKAANRVNYPAAAEGAGPVQLADVMDTINRIRNPGGTPGVMEAGQSAARPEIERAAALVSNRNRSLSGDYLGVLDAKQQIGDLESSLYSANKGYEAGRVGEIRKALDAALSDASPGYRKANDTSAAFERIKEALDAGRSVGTRERPENVIPAFDAMSIGEQQAFRHGYADKLISGFGGKPGVNKAAPLTGDFAQREIRSFAAPGRGDRFLRQIEREDQMSGLYNRATGGSPTFELFARAQDTGNAAELANVAKAAITGDIAGALKGAFGAITGRAGGNNEAVRNELVNLLTSRQIGRGGQPGGLDLRQIVKQIEQDNRLSQTQRHRALRTALGAMFPAISAINQPNGAAEDDYPGLLASPY